MIMRRCIDPVDLSAWVDGEITLRRSRAIQQHVEGCPRCAAEVAALRKVRQTVGLLAEAESGDSPKLPAIQQVRQWRPGRRGYAESQRLLRRLRVELTKEQARVVWGRGARYSPWYGALPRVRMRWGLGWQGAALALLLTTGVVGIARLPGLLTPSSSPSRPAMTDDAPNSPATSTVARLSADGGKSYEGDGGADDGRRDSSRQPYASGGVRLVTGSERQPETPGLVLWADQTGGESAPAGVAVVTGLQPERTASTGSPERRTTVSTAVVPSQSASEIVHGATDSGDKALPAGVGVTLASTATASAAAAATAGAAVAATVGTTAQAWADATASSLQPASAGRTVDKGDGERAATGVRPVAATTGMAVKPAAVAASATGNGQTVGKAPGKETRLDTDDQSGSEYQKEHERFAATVWSDSADYSEEALIKRVLLAAPAP